MSQTGIQKQPGSLISVRFSEFTALPVPSKGTGNNQQNSGVHLNRVHGMRVTGDLKGE
jgi:hypothetical protein